MPRGGIPKRTLPKRPGPGRPEKPIDWDLVDRLLSYGCTGTQIAARMDIHEDTLYARTIKEKNCFFSEYLASKQKKGETYLLEKQHEVALEGDRTLLVWLGKQRLKQSEDPQKLDLDKKVFGTLLSDVIQKLKEPNSEHTSIEQTKD